MEGVLDEEESGREEETKKTDGVESWTRRWEEEDCLATHSCVSERFPYLHHRIALLRSRSKRSQTHQQKERSTLPIPSQPPLPSPRSAQLETSTFLPCWPR